MSGTLRGEIWGLSFSVPHSVISNFCVINVMNSHMSGLSKKANEIHGGKAIL